MPSTAVFIFEEDVSYYLNVEFGVVALILALGLLVILIRRMIER